MDVGAGVTTDSEITGITFDRGRSVNGANIQLADGSGLTLTSCVIRNATGPAMAIGGVAVGSGSSLVMHDCEFRNNVMVLGGGLYAGSSLSLVATDCRFIANRATGGRHGGYGGAVADFGANSARFEGCTFEKNFGSPAGIGGGGGTVIVRECLFRANTGGRMGLYLSSPALTVERNTFIANNSTNDGGVVQIEYSNGVVRNNTIAFNDAGTQYWAALDVTLGPGNALTVEKNVVANNSGMGIVYWLNFGGAIALECNDSWGNSLFNYEAGSPTPPSNFSVDPQFCSPDTRDLTLMSTSPCLPGQHPDGADCGLVGRYDQGCQVIAVEPSSWSRIKLLGH